VGRLSPDLACRPRRRPFDAISRRAAALVAAVATVLAWALGTGSGAPDRGCTTTRADRVGGWL
jgi:hypothetical protein